MSNLDEIVAENRINNCSIGGTGKICCLENFPDSSCDSCKAHFALQDVLGIHKGNDYFTTITYKEDGTYTRDFYCKGCRKPDPCPTRQAISNRLEGTK